MTNSFFVELTFKLRMLSPRERAAQTNAAENSRWDDLGIELEDLEKSVAEGVGDADEDLLLLFAERL